MFLLIIENKTLYHKTKLPCYCFVGGKVKNFMGVRKFEMCWWWDKDVEDVGVVGVVVVEDTKRLQ